MHVTLRRAEIPMACKFLNYPHRGAAHRQVRAKRVSQNVWPVVPQVRSTGRSPDEVLNQLLGQWATVVR